ncbi:hypothetical protein ACH4S9_03200 [Streptomyces sp. NPDC021225]|uniref:hypothetical protein n=1 Tax=Streptomyces sp. NPDC021225 TaxID=3365121 RepID=UPI003790CCF7
MSQPPPPPGYGYPPPGPPGPPAPPQMPQQPLMQQPQMPHMPHMPQQGPLPGPPPGPPPGGGRASRRRQQSKSPIGVIVGAVVAIALVAGGVWLAVGKDSGDGGGGKGGTSADGAAVEAQLLNKIPMPKVDELVNTPGMWVTDKNWVKSDVNKIVGYPLAGGSASWEIPLKGELCWASPQVTEAGLTAVLFQDDSTDNPVCTQIGLVDLKKGKLLWTKQGRETGEWASDRPIMFDEVSIGGDTVAAGGISGGAAWSIDGKPLWMPNDDEDCSDNGYVGEGPKLIAVRECEVSGSPQLEVQTVDPKTRAVKSSYKVTTGIKYVHVVSTDPLVLGVNAGGSSGSGVSDFLAVDDSGKEGKLLSKFGMQGGKYEADCEATSVGGCAEIVVNKSANTLYLGTDYRASAESGPSNEIVAIDLKTGKVAAKADGAEGGPLVPVSLDKDGSLIAYQEATLSQGSAVWRVDTKSYEKKKLMQNPEETAFIESVSLHHQVIYAGGRLYIGNNSASKPSTDSGEKSPLALVLGAK